MSSTSALPFRPVSFAALLLLSVAASFPALRAAPLTIDASVVPAAPVPLTFAVGGSSPDGHTLSINSRYFLRDGQPWFPVMGEFHFARYPASEWEQEILKMKAGGIDIVSTYVFWIHHEETEGKFDWSGQRDLRAFVQLCAKHGLYVWVRIGPWDHGEVRNGGFPDWLVQAGPTRTNDPAYLDHVKTFYGQIGNQLKGLFWKDGGPIVGVQIENEYHPGRGGVEHMQTLLQLAHDAGIDAPFYTATGWDRATIPPTGFLPVFGGYTEQFWSNSLNELPPNVNFFFTPIRAEDNVGPNLGERYPNYNERYTGFPFLTAEMGGGMAIAYHRRPIMLADDSTSAALVKLGAGVTLLGYYMYHGGTNPDGLTPLQETQSVWNGYNDMEEKSYDFQAPLGEFGQFHPSFFTLKTLHLFINDFGAQLAPMTAYFPDQWPASTSDTSTPRATFRSDGQSGFLFYNNYERNYPLDEHKDFQATVKLPAGTLTIPREPTDIPSGAYGIWPVNLSLGGATLQYATAELLCHVNDPDTYVFFAWPGTQPEFAFVAPANVTIAAPSAQVKLDNGVTYLDGITPGTSAAIHVKSASGADTQIIVLTREQALHLWKGDFAGRERLILSRAGLYFDDGKIHLSARDPADLSAGIFPAPSGGIAGFANTGTDGVFSEYTQSTSHRSLQSGPYSSKSGFFSYQVTPASKPEVAPLADVQPTKAAGPSVPAQISRRNVAMEPADADFDRAADWSVHVPASVLSGPKRAFLEVSYEGDVARIYAGSRFADDNFYKGPTWEIGLWRFTPQELQQGLDLKILPLRSDTPLYLPAGARPAFGNNGEALNLKDVKIAFEYDAVMDAAR